MRPVQLITATPDELRNIITDAVAIAMRTNAAEATADAQVLSLRAAARLSKRRNATVLNAVQSGVLPAQRSGRRWRVQVAQVRAWCSAGCPEA